jgi:putative transcriptional regulator
MEKKAFTKLFGSLLKQQREKKGISQSEMARICFKDRQYIHRLENGTITPTLFTVYFICTELGIEINELIPKNKK